MKEGTAKFHHFQESFIVFCDGGVAALGLKKGAIEMEN